MTTVRVFKAGELVDEITGVQIVSSATTVLERRHRDARTLASESPLTVLEAEALLVACGGDMARARQEIANRVAMGAL